LFAEELIYFVIPSEARNLSLIETREKRDSSARSAPRNDKIDNFFAASRARPYAGGVEAGCKTV
jgi:hypothetical protein